MHSHLVAIEVGVKRGADQRMDLDGAAINQHRLKSLDAEAVEGGGAVKKDRSLLDHLFQNVIDFRLGFFHLPAGAFDIVRQSLFNEAAHDKGFEQFQSHTPGQTALVQFQFRSDDDDGTAAVVHALAEQVLAETPLLAAQHIGERLQLMVAADRDRLASLAVIDERINCLLEHALLVADDDFRRADIHR